MAKKWVTRTPVQIMLGEAKYVSQRSGARFYWQNLLGYTKDTHVRK
jgi:hypothetical protein